MWAVVFVRLGCSSQCPTRFGGLVASESSEHHSITNLCIVQRGHFEPTTSETHHPMFWILGTISVLCSWKICMPSPSTPSCKNKSWNNSYKNVWFGFRIPIFMLWMLPPLTWLALCIGHDTDEHELIITDPCMYYWNSKTFQAATLRQTNIAMQNPPFLWYYLPRFSMAMLVCRRIWFKFSFHCELSR